MRLLLKVTGVLLVLLQPVIGDVKRLSAQRAAVAAELAAEAAAALKAENEEAYKLLKEEQARVAAIKRAKEKKDAAATLARVRKEVKKMNPYSNRRDSYKYHVDNQYVIKAQAAPSYCMSLPAADNYAGIRNGLAVILAPCNISDTTQHFSYNPISKFVHPEANAAFCLDFEFDNKDLRPLTAFRCDKTFSSAAKPRHQEWNVFNASNIRNIGTKKCVTAGDVFTTTKRGVKKSKIYEGKAVQQDDCADEEEQWWMWVPKQLYKVQYSPPESGIVT